MSSPRSSSSGMHVMLSAGTGIVETFSLPLARFFSFSFFLFLPSPLPVRALSCSLFPLLLNFSCNQRAIMSRVKEKRVCACVCSTFDVLHYVLYRRYVIIHTFNDVPWACAASCWSMFILLIYQAFNIWKSQLNLLTRSACFRAA